MNDQADPLHAEFHRDTGLYAPATGLGGPGEHANREAWSKWLAERRATREAAASHDR